MDRLMWTSRSAMNAQQQKLDAISNNIANVNTNGYKAEKVEFSDLLYENFTRLGYPTNTNNANGINSVPQNGTGVKTTDWIRDNTQGSLTETSQETDLALDGSGYFRVIRPDGSAAYERSSDFNLDVNGRLVDSNGNILEINFTNGNTPLTKGNFMISQDGTLSVKEANGAFQAVGNINVYDAVGEEPFISVGNNLYVPKPGAQIFTANNTNIMQGYTENSNVDIAKEMVDMIAAQRAFQLNTKSLTTADEMWGMVNNLRSR
ncbi:flagellar basal-body rod protein FlgG [Clostridium pasteurianum DSM 525 = ATCC 6013]|uniref:Flagellar basal-body rod protein FlgG n=1 Tax=Clostridium pasteurianum DSM 525 = ATCC 6013 TaxID=1262449 RepID=A0A0H3J7L8_CLOPA|nr:flagellar hook-basal body complex protein [Clostridium pasteurianum]AJA47908.1 flagellar basal-body rod protein FlgG [Clostridium pasteurianum DSM 525 = ATCC 6013]AJA51896.1 flagellar basal-body rod protein FlgG [Clostridium pasteurianum DSM 525 = ATCC 6013]AOZ75197.1 flagellar biosynthesis protein FlgG [Clostridium pasteurianum DSM 525 = ATCC 6013]AOZ78992.1 flagellar biosynthesis protein FlgG [Clostridium pasteurianum]ELP59811.1 flagellar basal body rod protein FlgG [Clostridium pasteuria